MPKGKKADGAKSPEPVSSGEKHKQIDSEMDRDLECSICLKNFSEPKVLPNCLHTFCLKCLETYCKSYSANKIPCPLCRGQFSIPEGGLVNLQKNDFIKRLVLLKQLKEGKETIKCELCFLEGTDVKALIFCIDCKQSLCSSCDRRHKNLNGTKGHKVVDIFDRPSEAELQKMMPMYCSEHDKKEIELYCSKCSKLICMVCSRTAHSKHECLDMANAAQAKKEQITATRALMEDSFYKHIAEIMACREGLPKEFQDLDATQVKQIEDLTELYELNVKELNSFLTYSRIVFENGTHVEVIREADELQKRAEQLIKSQEERGKKVLIIRRNSIKHLGGSKSAAKSSKSDLAPLQTQVLSKPATKPHSLSSGLFQSISAAAMVAPHSTAPAPARKGKK